MSKVVMRCFDIVVPPPEYEHLAAFGRYLVSCDFDAYAGIGEVEFTDNMDDAKVFESMAEALAFWNTQSTVTPMRPDGRPNKPMTAYTVEVVKVD